MFQLRAKAVSAALLVLVVVGQTAQAAIIADAMDTAPSTTPGISNNYPWTAVIFGETSMSATDGVLTMSTNPGRGVWFGNGAGIGYYPGWSLSTNDIGTYISMTMGLSADATAWSMYFYDSSGYAASIGFNPQADYWSPSSAGISYSYAGDITHSAESFRPFDFSNGMHTIEVLLKGGQVSYALDGQLLYSGLSMTPTGPGNFIVIGDGSGSSPTGLGSMYVDGIYIDTAPSFDALAAVVPVPAALPLFCSALAGLAWLRRRDARA